MTQDEPSCVGCVRSQRPTNSHNRYEWNLAETASIAGGPDCLHRTSVQRRLENGIDAIECQPSDTSLGFQPFQPAKNTWLDAVHLGFELYGFH